MADNKLKDQYPKYGHGYELKRKSKYTVLWFKKQDCVKSFRIPNEILEAQRASFLSFGWTEIPDPFTKGRDSRIWGGEIYEQN